MVVTFLQFNRIILNKLIMKKILWMSIIFLFTYFYSNAQNIVYDANAIVRTVPEFYGISVGSGIKLYLSQGKNPAVAVSAEEKQYAERIITEVKNGILRIYVEGKMWNSWNWGNKKLKAYVTIDDLTFLGASGGSIISLVDNFVVNTLESEISGGSIIEGKIRGNAIDFELSGGSISKIDANFDHGNIDISGGSIIKETNFILNKASIDASGGSIIHVIVNKDLKVEASGGSIINYKGEATISSVETSGGSIVKKRE